LGIKSELWLETLETATAAKGAVRGITGAVDNISEDRDGRMFSQITYDWEYCGVEA
jgi:hypothetical protein